MKKRTTIWIEEQLIKKFKIKCINKKTNMSERMEHLIKKDIK